MVTAPSKPHPHVQLVVNNGPTERRDRDDSLISFEEMRMLAKHRLQRGTRYATEAPLEEQHWNDQYL